MCFLFRGSILQKEGASEPPLCSYGRDGHLINLMVGVYIFIITGMSMGSWSVHDRDRKLV